MAALLFLLQFLFFGTLVVPAYMQMPECNLTQSTDTGNFSVTVTPQDYSPNTTYIGKPRPRSFHTAQHRVSSSPAPAALFSLVVMLDILKTYAA